MLPTVEIKKQDGNTGVVRPNADGILAIIASSSSGTMNEAAAYNDESLAHTDYGDGPLAELAAYDMAVSQRSTVLVRSAATTAGAYSAITHTGGGTAVVTAGATAPEDDFEVQIDFVAGATIGVAGATYTYSLDGGKTKSAVTALGTANNFVIPNTGITVDFAAGTVVAGERLVFTTTRPLPTSADLPAALEALRVTTSPFDAVLIDMIADDTTVGLIAAWILDLNKHGKFPIVFATVRPLGYSDPTETEAQYKDALAALLAQSACVDLVLCADEVDLVSTFRGVAQRRPVAAAVAARAMDVDIGTEPAYVALGPLTGAKISDARNNPRHHNEEKYPGLDDLRLTTVRTIEGFEGVYVTNTNLFSASGSDYVFLPHGRVINKAAGITYQVLTKQLSAGVGKDPKPGPNGERYISDHAATLLEGLVNAAIRPAVAGKVDDLQFKMSRTDDISSNQGAVINCSLESVALAYVKKFTVAARYVKQIAK